jgi:hypothetical protein
MREDDIILLSSDNDETTSLVPRPTSGTRRVSPVSVNSTTDTSGMEDLDYLDDVLVDEDIPEDEFLDSPKMVQAESSGTTTSSTPNNKGKGKEVDSQQSLDLQEELECFICCKPFASHFL